MMGRGQSGKWIVLMLGLLLLPFALVAQRGKIKRIALHISILASPQPESAFVISIPETLETARRPSSATVHLPLENYRITSRFGWRRHPVTGKRDFHNGIDLAARAQVVRSIMNGLVSETGHHCYLGNYVRIDHGDVQSVYGHLSHIAVRKGQDIVAGQPIGVTGSSGRATGEHLHFGIRRGGTYIDPWKFLHGIIQQIDNDNLTIFYGQSIQ
ncbi:M23 family metallopeptidase [Sphingobacterium spiritivorum]|uniref:M23 family metallopeptidase n=1 Tax=Sphingobacterium spiritivorum TaxID=258 RepID=UPI003DA6345E